jgi:hypothetical protein
MNLSKYTASCYNLNKYQYPYLFYIHTHIYFPNTQEKTGSVTKVVKHLLCKWEALSLNSSPTKYKKNKESNA